MRIGLLVLAIVATQLRPNHSLKLTRYGMRCLAAPGQLSSNVRHRKQLSLRRGHRHPFEVTQ